MTIGIEMNQRVGTARANFEYLNIAIRKFLSSATLTLNSGQRSGVKVCGNTLYMPGSRWSSMSSTFLVALSPLSTNAGEQQRCYDGLVSFSREILRL